VSWAALTEELDRWVAAGRRPTLWWRDDGVVAWSPALYRLLEVTEAGPLPLALAVPPGLVDSRLAGRLARARRVSVFQHGVMARNRAPAGAPPSEFPDTRDPAEMAAETCRGWLQLAELFGRQARPYFVPPWNRADPAFLDGLGQLGFRGLSRAGPRAPAATDSAAPMQVNVHVDPLGPTPDMVRRGGFAGDTAVLDALIGHLAARRRGEADPDEPTGLLTHHRELDAAAWAFLERLVAHTTGHPAVRWLAPDVAFAPASAVGSYLRALPTVR